MGTWARGRGQRGAAGGSGGQRGARWATEAGRGGGGLLEGRRPSEGFGGGGEASAGPLKKVPGEFWPVENLQLSAVSSHIAICKQQLASRPRFLVRDGPHQHAELIGEGVVSNPWGRDPIARALAPHRAPFCTFVS